MAAGRSRKRRRGKPMLGGFVSAFRTPDLRRKLLFTMGVLALYRLGASVPTPNVDYVAIQK